jgi:Cu2+-containing amine oxidase
VVSYLDVGDGNYWAHPIENLVAVVDLEQKKIQKIEEGAVVPVPMARARMMAVTALKPRKNRSTSLNRKGKTTPLPAIWCTGRTGIST